MEENLLVRPTNQHFYGYQIKNFLCRPIVYQISLKNFAFIELHGYWKRFFCIDPCNRRAITNYPFAVPGIGALFIFMARDKMKESNADYHQKISTPIGQLSWYALTTHHHTASLSVKSFSMLDILRTCHEITYSTFSIFSFSSKRLLSIFATSTKNK